MVVVAGGAGGDHAPKVAGLDRIDVRTADTDFAVGISGVEPARSHETVFTAGRIGTDGAGLHVGRPVKVGLDTVATSFLQHLTCGLTCAEVFNFNLFFGWYSFLFDHVPSFMERLYLG